MGFVDANGSRCLSVPSILLKTSLSNALFFGEKTSFVCFLLRTLMHPAVSFTHCSRLLIDVSPPPLLLKNNTRHDQKQLYPFNYSSMHPTALVVNLTKLR